MIIIITGRHKCTLHPEAEDEVRGELTPTLTTITATGIITTTTATTITTTEEATTTRTTATKTFKLTLEERAAEEVAGPRCPGVAAPAWRGEGRDSLSAEDWDLVEVGVALEVASSRDAEWYVMCGWSILGVLAGGFRLCRFRCSAFKRNSFPLSLKIHVLAFVFPFPPFHIAYVCKAPCGRNGPKVCTFPSFTGDAVVLSCLTK